MPSTFTQNTGIEKPGDGEQAGLWGDTVNLSSDIIDRALNGSTSIALTSTSYTLTTAGGTLSEGQYAAVTFTGTPGGTATVTVAPSTAQKTYFIRNSTNQSVVITQGSGGNATIAAGRSAVVVCTGAGASSAVFDITAVMNTATSANTANAVVQRDGSGGFSAGAITATSGTVGGAAITTASNTQTLTNKTLTSPDINGGTIDGAVIGGTTPAAISGTAGTFSGDFAVGTNSLFVDSSTDYVGIGTASPAVPLEVKTSGYVKFRVTDGTTTPFSIATGANQVTIENNSVADTSDEYIALSAVDNSIRFGANGSEAVRINSAQSVGIGTTNPGNRLHVVDSTGYPLRIASSATGSRIIFSDSTSTNAFFQGIGCIGDDMQIVAGNSARVYVESNGNVGIGTTTPSEKLHVGGNIKTSGGVEVAGTIHSPVDTDSLRIYGGGNGDGANVGLWGSSHASNPNLAVLDADEHRFRSVGAVERMRITGAGNVGIGTVNPAAKLDVAGTVKATGLNLNGTAVTATAAELNKLDGVTATTTELNYTDGVTSNIQTQLNGKAATSTTISAGGGLTGGGSLAANRTISHADTSSQTSVNNSGAAVIQDVTLDTYGHVTALGSTTLSLGTFGVTSTAAELNKLDGFTGVVADLNYAKDLRATGVTTAEFDKLDGLTATTTELNYTDGVTSNIQTQLNGKASTSTSVSAGGGLTGGGSLAANRTISHADTSSQGSVNNSGATVIQDVTLDTYGHVTALGSTTLSLSTLGVTATATEVNYTDGVTSNIQTQLNSKMATSSYPDLVAIESLSSTGIAVRTGTNTWAQRQISGDNGILITNNNGVSGDITISQSLALGQVGTHAMLRVDAANDSTERGAASTLAGSALNYANCAGDPGTANPAGTWRLLGYIPASTTPEKNTSLWVRIA